MQLDWGVGRYETFAEHLLPAARTVVETAAIRPGESVLDLGCGTGNAALLAAERGAAVVGVDPAARLLDVARARATSARLDATFSAGEAASLPLPDGSVDVILSVFAVIFAPDPQRAAAEMSRVLASDGRIVLSAWIPAGAMMEMSAAAETAVREALGLPAPPPGLAWHEAGAVSGLLSPFGFAVSVAEHALTVTAPSAEAYLDDQTENHPAARSGFAVLAPTGRAPAVRAQLLDILQRGNETSDGFRMTSRYVVVTAQRHG